VIKIRPELSEVFTKQRFYALRNQRLYIAPVATAVDMMQ
jgi:hypothetical protein